MLKFNLCLVVILAAFPQAHSLLFEDRKSEVQRKILFYYVYGNGTQDYKVFSYYNGSEILKEPTYDPARRPLVFLSGFNTEPLLPNTRFSVILDVFLSKNAHNIIVPNYEEFVDNGKILPEPFNVSTIPLYYSKALTYYEDIGEVIAEFLINILTKPELNTLHLNGFSLGGQIAAVVASGIKKIGCLPDQITALDPAGPAFSYFTVLEHLNKNHAKNVFVIHSDAGLIGYACPCGTLDLWPNKGTRPQPGCETDIIGTCDHFFSMKLYACILTNHTYHASKCDFFNTWNCPEDWKWIPSWNWPATCNDGNITIDADLDLEITGNYYLNATLCDLDFA